MEQTKSILINIDTFDKIKKLARIVTAFESDINIYHGSSYYDAKSIMAIIALDLSKPRYIEIVSDNQEEINRFLEQMKQFAVTE